MSKDKRYHSEIINVEDVERPALDCLSVKNSSNMKRVLVNPITIFIQQRLPLIEKIPVRTKIEERKP
jgi:hypothetical protein